jgi:IS5 family transposase
MEKAIAHPTDDSRLLERCREHLVKAAARRGAARPEAEANYNREGPRLGLQIGR